MFTRTQWMLVVVALSCFTVHAGAAPLSFRHAIQLAARRTKTAVPYIDQESCEAETTSEDTHVTDNLLGSRVDYSVEMPKALTGAAAADATSQRAKLFEGSSEQISQANKLEHPQRSPNNNVVLNTAIAYSQLSWANLQLNVLHQQLDYSSRLIRAEKMRVVAEVDSEASLTRARLLEAQTRMVAANLEAKVLGLRKSLSDLTGLPEEQIDPDPSSILPFKNNRELRATGQTTRPDCEFWIRKLEKSIDALIAARDTAQLVYLLVHHDTMKALGIGSSKLGEQLASQVRDAEKFGVLLEAVGALQKAQLELLNAIGDLEELARSQLNGNPILAELQHDGGLKSNMGALDPKLSAHASNATKQSSDRSIKDKEAPSVKSILLLPSDSVLTVGDCRQLAAVAVSDGGGRDVTSVAGWASSNDSVAIVSTSGLITGLRPGRVTITASLGGVVQSRSITITGTTD